MLLIIRFNLVDHEVSFGSVSTVFFINNIYNIFVDIIIGGFMEDILNKNLAFINKFNKPLCDKILSVTSLNSFSRNFELTTNLAGQYNLLIDNKPVHSITDVFKEAKDLLNTVKINENTTIHCIYGIGLGYHIDEYIQNAKGKIIVYEPDIEAMYFVFSAVDFSDNFKKDRLYFVSDLTELNTVLYSIYRYKSNVTFSFLDYYKLYHKPEIDDFQKKLQRIVDIVDHNYTFQVNNIYTFFKYTLTNISQKYKNPLLTDYRNIYKNKPAIIVSAGPSLHKNIEVLKKYRDHALIFCVGTALRTLCSKGITPDFVNVIERNNTKVHYDVEQAKDIIFIAEPFTESSYLNMDFKKRLLTASLETDDARWFLEMADKELVDFETKGTVAYHAIYSAYYLGCNPIILVGQDLAYSDGDCYCKGSKFDGLQCVFDENLKKYKVVFKDFEKFKEAYCLSLKGVCSDEQQNEIVNNRLEELNKNLCSVEGQNGNMLPTDSVYSLFIDYIQDFAKRHKDERILINSSLGGAKLDGFNLLPLEKAIDEYAGDILDKRSIVDPSSFNTSVDYRKIVDNFKRERELLKSVLPDLNKGLSLVQNLNKELDRTRIYSSKASSIASKIIGIYSHLTNDIMVKHRIYKMIALAQYSEISYLMRLDKNISSYNEAKEYFDAYFTYFRNVSLKVEKIISFLDTAINELEEIYENSCAKS